MVNLWVSSFAPEFQCCYVCESSCLLYLSFNSDFYVSKIMHLCFRNLPLQLSLGVSMMVSFLLYFFPRDVLDGILDLIESVSEGFPTYSCISEMLCLCCVEILKKSSRTSI